MADLKPAELNRGRFEEEHRAVRAARIGHSAQAELLKEFFKHPFQVINIELGFAVATGPADGVALAGKGDGDASFFVEGGAAGRGARWTGRRGRLPYEDAAELE